MRALAVGKFAKFAVAIAYLTAVASVVTYATAVLPVTEASNHPKQRRSERENKNGWCKR
jgi:hypothetical protein